MGGEFTTKTQRTRRKCTENIKNHFFVFLGALRVLVVNSPPITFAVQPLCGRVRGDILALAPKWRNGRRGGLKHRSRKGCGFDSHLRHHIIFSRARARPFPPL